MPTVIGIDIGTYEAKGVVVDQNGRILASAVRAHALSTPQAGYAEHDAEGVWWDGLVDVVRQLLESDAVTLGEISAICCSGIGPCVLPIDAGGSALRPAILYGVDTRAAEQIHEMNTRLGEDAILAKSGNRLSSQSAGPKIAWLRDHEPDMHRDAFMFVTCQSFLVGRLTGSWVLDHATAGYFHPLYNLDESRWDLDGLDGVVREDQLPRLAWAGDVAGGITTAAATATGLPVGLPVLVGTADAPAEALSSGVVNVGEMMLMYGSSHFFIEVLDHPGTGGSLYSAPYLFPGSFVLAAGTATAGTVTRWFVDVLGRRQSTSGEVFAELAAEADASPPGANGLLVLPHFSGERTPLDDPLAAGAVFGLTVKHSRGDVFRGLLEGIAFGVRSVLDEYKALGALPTKIRAVGGGTKNQAWVQAVSDVTGLRQEVASGTGASYGDAMLAALACGFLGSREELTNWVTTGPAVEPRREFRALYERRHEQWRDLQISTMGIAHELRSEPTKGQSLL